jgi:RNA recognition motif-containing protein
MCSVCSSLAFAAGGLDDHVSKHEVEEFFSGQGSISNIWIAAKPPGFAFVEFGSPEAAEAAGTKHTHKQRDEKTTKVLLFAHLLETMRSPCIHLPTCFRSFVVDFVDFCVMFFLFRSQWLPVTARRFMVVASVWK